MAKKCVDMPVAPSAPPLNKTKNKREERYRDFDFLTGFETPDEEGQFNSAKSPSNLRYARSHEELSGRRDLPLSSGLSLRETLVADDHENLD